MKIALPIILAIACLVLGFLSGLPTFDSIENWYADLNKPRFNPPNWVFGPVWSVLYVMMGVAAGLIWNLGLDKPGVKSALFLFLVQMILNLAWTPVFFGAHQILAGLVIIILLWIAILLSSYRFYRLRKVAGWLMVPYLLWVSFAGALNAMIWKFNP